LTNYFQSGGSLEDLKQKGRNMVSEGKELGAEARKLGSDLSQDAKKATTN
jgi:hypothetical protein